MGRFQCGIQMLGMQVPEPLPPKKNMDIFQELLRENTRLLKDKFSSIKEWMDFSEMQIRQDKNVQIKYKR